MSRKLIAFIIVTISLALILLIFLQIHWLYNEYKIKEEQFNRLVIDVFNAVNKELEANETILEVTSEAFSLKYKVEDVSFDKIIKSSRISNPASSDNLLFVKKNALSYNDSFAFNTHTLIQVLKGDSVIFSKAFIKSKPEVHFFKNSDFNVNKEIANKLTQKTLFVEKIINKMLNYNEDLTKRIDFYTLYSILHKQFNLHNIYLNFEFAVKNNNGKIIFKTKNFDNQFKDVFKTQLFPNDIFLPSYYMTLYFPEKESFIATSLGVLGLVTIALILLIIFSYFIILYVIFRQKKLSEMKNDFINNMTHELKTPISTISLAAQMLSDRTICRNAEQMTNVTNIISQEAKKLAFQVEKVLQMALFERGEYRFNMKKLSINVLVENLCSTFELHVNKKNGKLIVDLEAIDDEIEADEMHLSNAVLNLLENALKYTNKEPVIHVRTYNIDNSIVISVKDNGIGISKQDQKHIFEKFYRVNTGNIHNVKGFGLGLSYVKIIAEAHSGTVKVISDLGKGSEFQIILPLNNYKYGKKESSYSFSRR